MTKVCGFCGTTEALAIKVDTESEYDEAGCEISHPVLTLICPACAEYHYDGTEDYPGTIPLAA